MVSPSSTDSKCHLGLSWSNFCCYSCRCIHFPCCMGCFAHCLCQKIANKDLQFARSSGSPCKRNPFCRWLCASGLISVWWTFHYWSCCIQWGTNCINPQWSWTWISWNINWYSCKRFYYLSSRTLWEVTWTWIFLSSMKNQGRHSQNPLLLLLHNKQTNILANQSRRAQSWRAGNNNHQQRYDHTMKCQLCDRPCHSA